MFYILTKGGKPTVKVGQVVSVSNPQPKYPSQFNPSQPYPQIETFVDIKVKYGEETMDFQQLPTNSETFAYNNAFVSDKKEAILAEVDNMLQNSKSILDSISYHESVIDSCNDILKELNPQFAKEKQQEEKIGSLETEVKSMKDDLGDIKELLISFKNNNNKLNNSK